MCQDTLVANKKQIAERTIDDQENLTSYKKISGFYHCIYMLMNVL